MDKWMDEVNEKNTHIDLYLTFHNRTKPHPHTSHSSNCCWDDTHNTKKIYIKKS